MIHLEKEEDFYKIIKKGVTLVDFYAPWCGPCKMIAPVIEELDEEYKDKINVVKVNVDDFEILAIKYGIDAIPVVMLFKDGEEKKSSLGYAQKEDLSPLIDELLLK